MPELPEVETLRRTLLDAGLIGRSVAKIDIGWERTVGIASEFENALKNRRFESVERRAKYLLLGIQDGLTVVAHMRMSGRLALVPFQTVRSGYERVVLTLDDGRELRFHDPRKFGRMLATKDPLAMLAKLAPEPFDPQFSAGYVRRYLAHRRRRLKPLLLDQKGLVAGLGNIYADEALWEARLHPLMSATDIKPPKATALHAAILNVLAKGIANLGTSLGTGQANFRIPGHQAGNQEQLNVFHRTGQPCPRCAQPIRRLVIAQRSTHICPRCQRI